jgi:hypothetical protein
MLFCNYDFLTVQNSSRVNMINSFLELLFIQDHALSKISIEIAKCILKASMNNDGESIKYLSVNR